jgi:hypothetical protein
VYREVLHGAFLDELQKISEVSLAGLSHESVQRLAAPAQPMETAGLTKALAVLARYEGMPKMAFVSGVSNPELPQMRRVTGIKRGKKNDKGAVEQGKNLAGYTAGGLGIGRLAGYVAHGPHAAITEAAKKSAHGKMWWGTVAGGALGAAEYARKRLKERKAAGQEKKAALVPTVQSPAKQLHYGQQTGKTQARGLKSGPSIHRLATKI